MGIRLPVRQCISSDYHACKHACVFVFFIIFVRNPQNIMRMKKKNVMMLGMLSCIAFTASFCGQPKSGADEIVVEEAVVEKIDLKDYGAEPTVLNIDSYTLANDNFRTALWSGKNLQVTLMSIPVGGDVGLEQHMHIDQFLRVEDGEGTAMMGDTEDNLDFIRDVSADDAIFVPAGKWHNIVNKGDKPLKIYSIYAPVEHPHGTVHKTQQEAEEAEHAH